MNIKLFWKANFLLFLNRDGTTDVTRTFHFGSPTDFQRVIKKSVLICNLYSFIIWIVCFVILNRIFIQDSKYLDFITETYICVIFISFFFILKECYTLVLKGYIDLANVKFMKMPSGPYGTNLHVLICIIYHYRKKTTEWYDIKNTGLKNNLGNLDTLSKNFLSKSNICFRVKKGVIHIGGPSKSVKLLTKLLYKVLAFLLTLTHS